MCQKVLLIKLLLLHYATQSQLETLANCYEDVPVMCPDVDFDRLDFISVAWYKFHNQKKLGIIRRGKDNITYDYDFARSPKPRFGEKNSLLLPSVTHEDSGTYQCDISANVGGRNQNLKVNLTVVCVTQPDRTTMTTVLNATQSDLLCHNQVEDLPVMWSIIGCVAVGLAKIVLSLISIWVIKAARMRSSRRRQHKW